MIDDDTFQRLASDNKARIAAAGDSAAALQAIVTTHDVVFGLYPDKEAMVGWDKYLIKGDLTPDRHDARVTAIWCRSLEDAIDLAHRFGA